jgi:hypothetical protein
MLRSTVLRPRKSHADTFKMDSETSIRYNAGSLHWLQSPHSFSLAPLVLLNCSAALLRKSVLSALRDGSYSLFSTLADPIKPLRRPQLLLSPGNTTL